MTEHISSLQQVNDLLNTQKGLLKNMLNTLDLELEAIRQRSGEALINIAQEKEQQLIAIKKADAAINNESSIELIKSTPELTQLKQEVLDLLQQCQQKNEVCYLTASQNQVAIEQVKSLLIGGSKNTTYNELGQKNSFGSLGKGIKA